MNKAKVWFRESNGDLNSTSVKVEQDFEIHDGYVRIGAQEKGAEVAAMILPMHRIVSIEEYQ